ncbi:MAG: hypothetical protein A4E53_00772 [Pelotomaculum sp. PtaB.Bin104]|nr:MAG: hypothetical protein A4E53_00772 [Pelotomaculum sp. PtaB.Bin104]
MERYMYELLALTFIIHTIDTLLIVEKKRE